MKLPPLQSIRAFEAVARLGSVTAAAEELFVTHSAISHQIRNLEEWFATPMMERHGRGVRLTDAGERYKISVCQAFKLIQSETDLLQRQRNSTQVRVSSLPMFAVSWLMTQMHDFWAKHPDVQVALHYSRVNVSIDPEMTDVAIRHGRPGDFPGFVAMPLLDATSIPVASPFYLEREGYRSFADFSKLSLVHDEDRKFWASWLTRAGLDPMHAETGNMLPDGNLTLAAIMAGDGVGLLPKAIIEPQLRSGTLVPLSKVSIFDDVHYLVLTPKARPVSRSALTFVQWLQSLPGSIRLGVPRA
jgi:LysR family transcriptional regulator, glycine cleavage system transcriptional activator